MTVKYCLQCGNEKGPSTNYCGNCGYDFTKANLETAASATIPMNTLKKTRTIGNILINIIFSFFLVLSYSVINRHITWGGGESYLGITFFILVTLQILVILLHKKRKSYSLLIPTIISIISVFPMVSMYKEFTFWLEYQGYQTQEMVNGDRLFLILFIAFYIVSTVLNSILFFFKSNKQ